MVYRRMAVLFVSTFACSALEIEAESPRSSWSYRAWQTEDGLPTNNVIGVAQSSDGFLWVATTGGLLRFNGTSFTSMPLGQGNWGILAMVLDRRGNLWIETKQNSLICFEGSTHRVFSESDGIPDKRIQSIEEDHAGRMWVSYPGIVCRIDNGQVTTFGANQGIRRARYSSLTCDAGGRMWLIADGRLGLLGEKGFKMVRDFKDSSLRIAAARHSGLLLTATSSLLRLDSKSQIAKVATLPLGTTVNTIFEDSTGSVWLCTRDRGLLRADDGSLETVGTSHAGVTCITEDRDGNIWAGTVGGGLNLIRPRIVELLDSTEGLPFLSVRSITSDTSGRLWAVSQNGRLAYRDPDGWHMYTGMDEAELINCVTSDDNGRVWAGSRNRGLLQIEGDDVTRFSGLHGLTSLSVRSLLAAKNGDIWIATDAPERLHRLHDGKISPLDHTGSIEVIRALAESADGTIWVGTSNGRLLRVDGDSLVDGSAADESSSLSIRTLHASADGRLWIGYAGAGLGYFNNGNILRITTDDGLYDNNISQIRDDDRGSLWIASNRGLFQVGLEELFSAAAGTASADSLRCRFFGRNDGIPSIQPSRDYAPTAATDLDNRLYFSTRSGILEVHPGRIGQESLPPPVIIEKVSLDSRTVAIHKASAMSGAETGAQVIDLGSPRPQLDIPADHTKLTINFSALSFASPENVQLRYRLKPIDENWVEVENGDDVTFPRQPTGNYEFHVIASDHLGVWNKSGATLSFNVQPFYWQTWWFRISIGMLAALIVGSLVSLGLRRKHQGQLQRIAANRALEQERSRIARDIHDDLGSSLTRITLLSQSSTASGMDSKGTTLDQIHSTALHLMRSMEEVVWAVNPEHDTFDALANYISNYAQSFLRIAGVRCRLNLPISLPERTLSAQLRHNLFLAFKEALNNTVKHAAASEVRISLKLDTDFFALNVVDNGQGFVTDSSDPTPSPTSGSGSGLANMKNRMDEIGGTCSVHSAPGQGTTVEFKAPFKIHPSNGQQS